MLKHSQAQKWMLVARHFRAADAKAYRVEVLARLSRRLAPLGVARVATVASKEGTLVCITLPLTLPFDLRVTGAHGVRVEATR
jgi:hypothetical protein